MSTKPVELQRLQKVLAAAGYGSRRQMETWIEGGRLSINDKIATLGDKVSDTDLIKLDGRIIHVNNKNKAPRVLIYNKPEGEICTAKDPEGRPTVFSKLPKLKSERWIGVGRLDINSMGLMLFTNSGEIAHRLMHPSYEIEREYAVRVYGNVSQSILQELLDGIELDDGLAKFNSIKDGGGEGMNHWYHVCLSEGRNREVRRLWQARDIPVSRLMRVRYGPITMPRYLRIGHHAELTEKQIKPLLKIIKLGDESKKR